MEFEYQRSVMDKLRTMEWPSIQLYDTMHELFTRFLTTDYSGFEFGSDLFRALDELDLKGVILISMKLWPLQKKLMYIHRKI
jgi:hypothetical protein